MHRYYCVAGPLKKLLNNLLAANIAEWLAVWELVAMDIHESD